MYIKHNLHYALYTNYSIIHLAHYALCILHELYKLCTVQNTMRTIQRTPAYIVYTNYSLCTLYTYNTL